MQSEEVMVLAPVKADWPIFGQFVSGTSVAMAVLAPPAGRRAKRSLSPVVPAEVATRHERTCAVPLWRPFLDHFLNALARWCLAKKVASYIWELIAVPDTTVLYWQSDGNHAASGSKTIREVKWASMVLRLECSLLEITQILKSLIWVLFFNFKYFCRIKAFK